MLQMLKFGQFFYAEKLKINICQVLSKSYALK